MPVLQVVSSRPLAGKSTIAAALARGLTSEGAVRLIRAGQGPAAEQDAETFAAFTFASTAGRPVPNDALSGLEGGGIVIVEPDAGDVPLPSAGAVVVVRGEVSEGDAALGAQLGDRLAGSIATNVPPGRIEEVARALTNANLRPLALIPEDRRLAAPCVDEIREALDAEVLYEGENAHEVVEDFLVAPVYSDPASPHFRRFASKAVLAPFNKTDLHLAAIETRAVCLVITGGGEPSPYVHNRALGEATTVLLAKGETPATIAALSDVWLTSRFRGMSELEAAYSHLQGRLDFAGLLKKID